jgi:hypothetical protein
MKFRIVEQRGVFRINQTIYQIDKYKSSWFFGVKVKDGKEDFWDLLCKPFKDLDSREMLKYVKGASFILEVNTYQKAENYIKKFYGSTGVDAIEKPEWKTV